MKSHSNMKAAIITGLAVFLLFTGCANPLDPPVHSAKQKGELVPGTGTLLIQLDGATARTLLPGEPVFSRYSFIFTPQSGQKTPTENPVAAGETYSINLITGSWKITAIGYVQITGVEGFPDGEYEAARGSKTVSVSEGTNAVNLSIKGGIDQGGQGIFSYSVSPPTSGVTAASLRLTPWQGGTPVIRNLLEGASGAITLDVGYYLLRINSTVDGHSSSKAEVVHIYGGMTTALDGAKYGFYKDFASIVDLSTYLAAAPANTKETPYGVALIGVGLDPNDFDSIYNALNGKFVVIDLSACTGTTLSVSSPSGGVDRDKIVSITLHDSVTSIGQAAFYGCSSLVSIDLPDSVTTIGDNAFRNCTSLTSIDLPNSLNSIGQGAFGNCTSLPLINLPNSLTSISAYTFEGCSSLTSIDLPNSLTSIPYRAFEDCIALISVDLPTNLISIVEGAFRNCVLLSSINLPNSLNSIGQGAFAGCSSLSSINLPSSLASIGEEAFAGCSPLTSINLPDSLTSIGRRAFSGLTLLTSVDLPDSLTSLGYGVFDDCTNITFHASGDGKARTMENGKILIFDNVIYHWLAAKTGAIVIPDGITAIASGGYVEDSSTFSGSGITSIKLPDTLTSIGYSAFKYCESLVSIDLPATLTSIGAEAFWYCESLTSIDLPATLTRIDYQAFMGCSSLTSVKINADSPPEIGYDIFESIYLSPNLLIYVPDGSVATYQAASNWSSYAAQIKPISEMPPS